MDINQHYAAERKRRQIAELQEADEAAEREAARQKHLEEMRSKPNCGLPKGKR